MHRHLPILLVLAIALPACATRQTSDTVSGSTAQRLVTYSLERFVRQLVEQPELQPLRDKRIALNAHFIHDYPLLGYARQLLQYQLRATLGVSVVNSAQQPEYILNVFFNSIATDHDSYGLSLPTFGLASTPDARLSVLSIDMFHGVTEGYATIADAADDSIVRTERILSRVRADNVATPVLDFPVNQLD